MQESLVCIAANSICPGSGARCNFKQQILNATAKFLGTETNFGKVYFSVNENNIKRCFGENTEAF